MTLVADQAMERAREADEALAHGRAVGPLHGLPIAHKDLQPTNGIRTTFGSPIFKDFVPVEDSLIVERLRRAGAIVVGKTNTPEFGAGSQTFNPVFGATLNPYDRDKTCGGSSGGAAVALGDRHAADRRRQRHGRIAPQPRQLLQRRRPAAVAGPGADVAGRHGVVHAERGRSDGAHRRRRRADAERDRRARRALADRASTNPGSRFAAPLERDFKGVRVAWWKDLGGVPVDRARPRRASNAQRGVFESLGCIVEEAEPDFADFDAVFKTVRALAFLTGVAPRVAGHRDQVKETILWEIDRGERLTAAEIAWAETKRTELYHRMRQFMERYEFFVLPVSQVPPFDVDQPYVTEIDGVAMETYIDWMKSCYYISIVGEPGDLGAVRLHAGRSAGRPADRRPASRRLGRAADGARLRTSGSPEVRRSRVAHRCSAGLQACRVGGPEGPHDRQ